MSSRRYVVDRFEGRLAVLMADDEEGATVDVSRAELPAGIEEGIGEGAVLVVPISESGQPQWGSATRDLEEEARRLEEAKAILEELKRRDGGGDVVL